MDLQRTFKPFTSFIETALFTGDSCKGNNNMRRANACRLERFVRREGRIWTYVEHRSRSETASLETIGCEIELRDVYVKVF